MIGLVGDIDVDVNGLSDHIDVNFVNICCATRKTYKREI